MELKNYFKKNKKYYFLDIRQLMNVKEKPQKEFLKINLRCM